MRLVLTADTHGLHEMIKVPDGDVFICAGDMSMTGKASDVENYARWLRSLPHKHKILVAGNHDWIFEKKPKRALALLGDSCTYLRDNHVVIDGVKFWGSPWQPWFYDWAFNLKRGKEIAEKWSWIHANTDVLITHGPPYRFLDGCVDGREVGCQDLADRISVVKPKVHVFGHIHHSYGKMQFGETTYVNASVCTARYVPSNIPIVIDI